MLSRKTQIWQNLELRQLASHLMDQGSASFPLCYISSSLDGAHMLTTVCPNLCLGLAITWRPLRLSTASVATGI
jgi:hypothetical protein